MKKFLKILGIVVVVIIAALIILPYAFSDKIEQIVKDTAAEYVDADIDYDDFSLSIFSSFPDLRAGVDGLKVTGHGKFAGDTLAYIGSFKADFDIMSVFSGQYKVNALIINNPVIRGIVAKDSTANWDIVIASDTTAVEEETPDTAAAPLNLNLDRIEITNANIAYIDSTSDMEARIGDLDLMAKAKLNGDITNILLDLDIEGIGLIMENTNYVKNATLNFDADIEADLAQNKFTFKENTLNFAGVPLAFDGWVQLGEAATSMDIKLAANETEFKTILALVPDAIMKQVAGLQTKGSLELYAYAKGDFVDMDHIPALDVVFKINDGFVKYPDLPKSLNDINIDVAVKNPSGAADLTTVDVNKFHFELGQNPFDASLNLKTPMSNPTFSAKVNGTIDLGSLKDALPLDSMSIDGVVAANIAVATDLNTINAEKYENVSADGTLGLKNFIFEMAGLDYGVSVPEAQLKFTPKYVELNPLKAIVGKSDFAFVGKVENYLAYVLSDGTIKGTATLKSKLIDCNELIGESAPANETASAAEAAPVDTVATAAGVVEVPKNIDFTFNTAIDKILYDNLTITNTSGAVKVNNGVANLSNLKLGLCDGSVTLNGKYNTENIEKPTIDMDIDLSNVDINQLANSFSTVDTLLPIAKSAHGRVNIALDITSQLDQTMSPILKTLNGKGSFNSNDIALKESDYQKKLSKILNNDKYNNMAVKNCKVSFTIENGSIVVKPFNFDVFKKKATFSGKQDLDMTMDYLLSLPLERTEVAKLIGNAGISANTWSKGADIPVGVTIGGSLTSPQFGLNLDEAKAALIGEAKEVVKEKVTEAAQEAIDKVTEKATEKAKEVIEDKLKDNEAVNKAAEKAKNSLKGLFKK